MIETFPQRLMQQSERDGPLVLVSTKATIECGCSGYVGKLMSNMREVTLIRACSPKHDGLADTVQRALSERLQRPLNRPLVQLVDELLREAERVVG